MAPFHLSEDIQKIGLKCGQFSQPQATGNSNPPSGNRFAAESDGSGNRVISQWVYDSPYARRRVGRVFAPDRGALPTYPESLTPAPAISFHFGDDGTPK